MCVCARVVCGGVGKLDLGVGMPGDAWGCLGMPGDARIAVTHLCIVFCLLYQVSSSRPVPGPVQLITEIQIAKFKPAKL